MKSYYHTNGGKYTCQLKTIRLAKDGLQFSDGADPQKFFHLPSHCINTAQVSADSTSVKSTEPTA